MDWYLAVLQKYATFEGRARRKEYWMYALITFGISILLAIVDGVTGIPNKTGGIGLSTLYSLAVLIPGLAVTVRRLHDTNHSGFWILIAFVPIIGAIILLFWSIKEGDSRRNDFGPNPKAGERKSYDDEDDDERPRKKRSRNEDDDDDRDERPRNKRRNDDD